MDYFHFGSNFITDQFNLWQWVFGLWSWSRQKVLSPYLWIWVRNKSPVPILVVTTTTKARNMMTMSIRFKNMIKKQKSCSHTYEYDQEIKVLPPHCLLLPPLKLVTWWQWVFVLWIWSRNKSPVATLFVTTTIKIRNKMTMSLRLMNMIEEKKVLSLQWLFPSKITLITWWQWVFALWIWLRNKSNVTQCCFHHH